MKKIKLFLIFGLIFLVLLTGCDSIMGIFGDGDEEDNKVAKPIFSPQPDVFSEAQTIAIACATSGATIYYTTDGFIPTVASSPYDGPFTLDTNTTVKAIAVKEGMENSDVAEGNFYFGSADGEIVGMLFQPGLWDDDFNLASYDGLLAARDEYDILLASAEAESNDYNDLLSGMTDLAGDGAELVFGISWDVADAIVAAAAAHSGTHFIGLDAVINTDVATDNVTGIQFAVHESAFLAGIVAGYMTKDYASASEKLNTDNVVGMVKGMDGVTDVERYAAGFYAGVRLVNPDCQILTRTSGSFVDYDQGYADAEEMIGLGADIIFNIAGLTGIGAMAAAQAAGVLAVGVDIDQNDLYADTIITSAVKDYAAAVEYAAGVYLAGALPGGENLTLTMTEGATGIAPFHGFDDIIPQAVKDTVAQAAAAISLDDCTVPESMDDMINIGVAGAHSGDNDVWGLPTLNTLYLMAQQFNYDGGILDRFINIIPGNDMMAPAAALTVAQDLVDQDVAAVIGHTSSSCTTGALTEVYTSDNNAYIPVISPSATSPPLTKSGSYTNFFRTIQPDDALAEVLVAFGKDELSKTSFAVIWDDGSAETSSYYTDCADYVKAIITAQTGISTVYDYSRGF